MGEGHISSSSFFDLKAEVLKRKREIEEVRKSQLGPPSKRPIARPPNELPSEKADKLAHPTQPRFRVKSAPSNDDVEALAKSQTALEAKSRLYDRFQKDELAPDTIGGESSYLVDFDRKGWDPIKQEVVEPLTDNSDAVEDPMGFLCHLWSLNEGQVPDEESDEIVDYVDEFGRTRRVKAREKARLDAEKEETIKLLNGLFNEQGLEPRHYDPNWEIRDKGVGFFSFSSDTRDRKRQLRALQDLRQHTVESRVRAAIIREERRIRSEERRLRLKERRAQTSSSASSSSIFASLFSQL